MKHAGPDALAELAGLLDQLRTVDGLVEKRPGVFSRRSRAALHFHEDPSRLYADVRLDPSAADFERVLVTTPAQQARLVREVRAALRP